ncbi:MAG: hypothetical protein ACKVT1_18490 [Dehalococcoidia bacterium]
MRAGAEPPSGEYTERARPVLEDLHNHGFEVDRISDLYNYAYEYGHVMPRLLHWLPRIDDPDIKNELARAITDKLMRPQAAQTVLDEFPRAPVGSELQWVLGNTLATVADDSVFDEVAAIAQDRTFGQGRGRVIAALGNMKKAAHRETAIDIAIAALADEDPWVQAESLRLLTRRRAKRARPQIEAQLRTLNGPFEKEMRKAFVQALARLA